MLPAERIARLVRENYSDHALDSLSRGVVDRSLDTDDSGFASVAAPRDQQDEPFRSFHLIDSRALGDIVVTSFSWGDILPSEATYLMPLDTTELGLENAEAMTYDNVLVRYIEWTLGGSKKSWLSGRGTALGPRMFVVRSWLQDG